VCAGIHLYLHLPAIHAYAYPVSDANTDAKTYTYTAISPNAATPPLVASNPYEGCQAR